MYIGILFSRAGILQVKCAKSSEFVRKVAKKTSFFSQSEPQFEPNNKKIQPLSNWI